MHASIKIRRLIRPIVISASIIVMAGCAQTANISGNQSANIGSSSNVASTEPQPSIFPDIPIPQGAKMNVDRTLVVGTEDWFGQLVLEATGDAFQMFDFYRAGLPKFDWAEITSVRGPVSVLTYEREQRILQMQITSGSLTGSIITITVSPRGGASSSAS